MNMKSDRDYSPLHYACFKGSFDVASFICKSEINDENELNYMPATTINTPIYLAVASRSAPILELLFQCGAKLSGTPDYINKTIAKSIELKDMKSFTILTNHINSIRPIYNGYSLIMHSVLAHLPEAIPILIKLGDNINHVTNDGRNALFLACSEKSEEMVELLLDNGANANEKLFNGQYPIHWAVSSDNVNIVNMIISHGCNPKVTDDLGRQPTFFALTCRHNIDKILKILLDAGCNPNLQDRIRQNTIMSGLICLEPYENVLNAIKIVLESGFDLNIVGRNGKTIYQTAKIICKPEILEVIDEFIRNHPQ